MTPPPNLRKTVTPTPRNSTMTRVKSNALNVAKLSICVLLAASMLIMTAGTATADSCKAKTTTKATAIETLSLLI